ncbi:hypothetical protein CEXT_70961 [Caerostris extrusa]|uniref:Uncharacterized protein n=1 Tax=Caerostris extrusa TaxID=172846 RepID=A0AAV4TUX8_CAEEX|nr:hypothetical protein CEXT_70961 [Caerostris extrusa]
MDRNRLEFLRLSRFRNERGKKEKDLGNWVILEMVKSSKEFSTVPFRVIGWRKVDNFRTGKSQRSLCIKRRTNGKKGKEPGKLGNSGNGQEFKKGIQYCSISGTNGKKKGKEPGKLGNSGNGQGFKGIQYRSISGDWMEESGQLSNQQKAERMEKKGKEPGKLGNFGNGQEFKEIQYRSISGDWMEESGQLSNGQKPVFSLYQTTYSLI